jgi:hypothetical protein
MKTIFHPGYAVIEQLVHIKSVHTRKFCVTMHSNRYANVYVQESDKGNGNLKQIATSTLDDSQISSILMRLSIKFRTCSNPNRTSLLPRQYFLSCSQS